MAVTPPPSSVPTFPGGIEGLSSGFSLPYNPIPYLQAIATATQLPDYLRQLDFSDDPWGAYVKASEGLNAVTSPIATAVLASNPFTAPLALLTKDPRISAGLGRQAQINTVASALQAFGPLGAIAAGVGTYRNIRATAKSLRDTKHGEAIPGHVQALYAEGQKGNLAPLFDTLRNLGNCAGRGSGCDPHRAGVQSVIDALQIPIPEGCSGRPPLDPAKCNPEVARASYINSINDVLKVSDQADPNVMGEILGQLQASPFQLSLGDFSALDTRKLYESGGADLLTPEQRAPFDQERQVAAQRQQAQMFQGALDAVASPEQRQLEYQRALGGFDIEGLSGLAGFDGGQSMALSLPDYSNLSSSYGFGAGGLGLPSASDIGGLFGLGGSSGSKLGTLGTIGLVGGGLAGLAALINGSSSKTNTTTQTTQLPPPSAQELALLGINSQLAQQQLGQFQDQANLQGAGNEYIASLLGNLAVQNRSYDATYSPVQRGVTSGLRDLQNVQLGNTEAGLLNFDAQRAAAGPQLTLEQLLQIQGAADLSVQSGLQDLGRFQAEQSDRIRQASASRGLRPSDSPIVSQQRQLAEKGSMDAEQLIRGVRTAQLAQQLQYPLDFYQQQTAGLANATANLSRRQELGQQIAKDEQLQRLGLGQDFLQSGVGLAGGNVAGQTLSTLAQQRAASASTTTKAPSGGSYLNTLLGLSQVAGSLGGAYGAIYGR